MCQLKSNWKTETFVLSKGTWMTLLWKINKKQRNIHSDDCLFRNNNIARNAYFVKKWWSTACKRSNIECEKQIDLKMTSMWILMINTRYKNENLPMEGLDIPIEKNRNEMITYKYLCICKNILDNNIAFEIIILLVIY